MTHSLVSEIRSNPSKWSCDKYYFTNGKVRFWIANGFFFFRLADGPGLPFMDKLGCYMAFRWWLRNAPVECFENYKD